MRRDRRSELAIKARMRVSVRNGDAYQEPDMKLFNSFNRALPAAGPHRRVSRLFRTRAPARDQASDRRDLDAIREAIEHALASLRLQRQGLSERIAHATAAAAFAAGNDLYEHQTREADETNLLRRWEAELILAGRRLQVIDKNISHLESFQIAYLSVFPEALRLSPRDTHA